MTKLEGYIEEKHGLEISAYQLDDTRDTGGAGSVVERCKLDAEKFPVMISSDEDKLIGCFILHIGFGPRQYGFYGDDVVLLRAFSIDDRFRRQGNALSALTELPTFIHQKISSRISHVILAVNHKNIVAQKTYGKAGFEKVQQTFEGNLGTLFIMEKEI